MVVSDSLTSAQTVPWHNTQIVKRADAHAEIARLKQRSGKEILIFGSHMLWNNLLAAGLVDELHLMVSPKLLGGGTAVSKAPRH